MGLVSVDGVTDDMAFARALFREQAVMTAPGSYFRAPGRLRLSLGARPASFSEGLARFLDFADRYRP